MPPPSFPAARRVFTRFLTPFSLALVLLLIARVSHGVLYAPHPGKWTPADGFAAIGVQAVHMLLVPDSTQEYGAKIVWWTGEDALPNNRTGGVFGWDPEDLWCGGQVSAALTDDTTLADAGYNIFCTGQIQLPGTGGRIMTIGGTDGDVEIGVANSVTLRSAWRTRRSIARSAIPGCQPTAWSTADGMRRARCWARAAAPAASW